MQTNPKLLELRPDRSLLNSDFAGYKLSLAEISTCTRQIDSPVDRLVPDANQYSLLHAKLYGLHNHLVGESDDEEEAVYFIDTSWNLKKFQLDGDIITVWQLPRQKDRQSGDYNVSIKLVTSKIAVVADGTGYIYFLDRGPMWNVIFSGEVAGPNQNFVIVDVAMKYSNLDKPELHLLLLSIRQKQENERFSTILHWITLVKTDSWNQVALRELTVHGFVQYANFERSCEAIYVVSDSGCKFTLDSENEVKDLPLETMIEKRYTWSQGREDNVIKIPLSGDVAKNLVNIKSDVTSIEVKYGEEIQLKGILYQRIDSDSTFWTLEDNVLKIVLQKSEAGLMWPELIPGDQFGEYVADVALVEEVVERLAPLTSENEVVPATGTTFNSQQVEECDFALDKITIFERIDRDSHLVSHRANLGSQQVLLTANLGSESVLGFGVRFDVDTCIWQPNNENEFCLAHEGTLLAMGYIQASKQQMKYFVCSPDLSYSAICESTQHLFIYCQKKPITSNELRHRTTGRRINTLAQQQVYKLPSNVEVLGIYASKTHLYILGENYISALKI